MIRAGLRKVFRQKPSQKEIDVFASSAGGGRLEVVKDLLKKYGSAILNEKNEVGNTALICATANGRRDVMDFLIGKGADMLIDGRYNSLLHYAAQQGYDDIADMVLKKGINANKRNCNLYTPLMEASSHGHDNLAKLLLDRGADVNLKSDSGWTALMLAARYGHADTAKLLLDAGADMDRKDHLGRTALMIAGEYDENDGNMDVIDMLMEWPEIERQRLEADIADFSPALKRDIKATRPLVSRQP